MFMFSYVLENALLFVVTRWIFAEGSHSNRAPVVSIAMRKLTSFQTV